MLMSPDMGRNNCFNNRRNEYSTCQVSNSGHPQNFIFEIFHPGFNKQKKNQKCDYIFALICEYKLLFKAFKCLKTQKSHLGADNVP